MREIKFRAWYHTEKRMIDWNEMQDNSIESLDTYFRGVFGDVSPVMQYTGLKDKNGKEIYEGDIVQNFREKFIVEYWGGQILVSWYLRSINSGDTSELDCFGEYEVIGNIYENPELLGSEDK